MEINRNETQCFLSRSYNLSGRHVLQIRKWRLSEMTCPWLDSNKARTQNQASGRSGLFSCLGNFDGRWSSGQNDICEEEKRMYDSSRFSCAWSFASATCQRYVKEEIEAVFHLTMLRVMPGLTLTQQPPPLLLGVCCVFAVVICQTPNILFPPGKRALFFVMLTKTKNKHQRATK